jgi:hypothetical protein
MTERESDETGGLSAPEREPAETSERGEPERGESWSKPIGRRTVLSILGLGGLGIVFGSDVQKGISGLLRSVHAGSVASLVPGGGQFVLYTVTNGYPATPADYRLTVGGLVRRPLSLTLAELESLPATRLTRTFQCVTGWSVEDVHWVGVPLVELTSFDGLYTESLTMRQARETGAIVAYSMLGAPVTREHGGPVRLYVPDMFGYKSIKWLSGIRLVARAKPGYWEQNGYPVNAWIGGHPPRSAA